MKKRAILNKVAEFRKATGLRSTALAARMGITRQALYKIEQGKAVPSLLLALKLAQYFDTSVNQLFELEEMIYFNDPANWE